MSTTPTNPTTSTEEQPTVLRGQALLDAIGGPNAEQIAFFKSQSPNDQIGILPLGKRVFVCRPISGLELAAIDKNIPQNDSQPELTRAVEAAALCVVWTNANAERKLTPTQLRTGAAGMPQTLWNFITALSDFMSPEAFQYVADIL